MAVSCDRIVMSLRKRGHLVDVVHLVPSASANSSPSLAWLPRESGRELLSPLHADRPHSLNLLAEHLLTSAPPGGWTHTVAFGGNIPVLAAPVLAAWSGSELVVLLRGNDFDTAVFSSRKRAQLLAAIDACRAVGAVSTTAIARLRALRPAAPAIFTPNGIDTELWATSPSFVTAAEGWRERHNPGGDRIVVGLFGTLKAKKGASFLVRQILAANLADHFLLRIVGTPDAEFKSVLTEAGEALRYQLEPPAPRAVLPGKYLSCDLVALPSFYDGMPNVLLEAGALGVPILASLVGGIADVAGSGDFGFTFPPGDREACTAALHRAAASTAGQRRAFGRAFAHCVASRFSPAAEADAILETLTLQSSC